MVVKPDESTLDEPQTTAGILGSTLEKHPVFSLLTAAFVLVATSVGLTYATLNVLLIQPLATKVEDAASQTAAIHASNHFVGSPIEVREAIDNKQSIVVLEGRMDEGESALSIDGNVVVGVTAIDGELITIGGFFLETHNPFRIQLKPGMSIETDPALAIGLHSYSISVKEIQERSAYVVCRCIMKSTIHSETEP